jgi:hypothetical protein
VNGKTVDISREGVTFDDVVKDLKKMIEDELKKSEESKK